MGPKVQAALRFVGDGGERAAIGALGRLRDAAEGTSGTQVTA
jgi:carbamate kinase